MDLGKELSRLTEELGTDTILIREEEEEDFNREFGGDHDTKKDIIQFNMELQIPKIKLKMINEFTQALFEIEIQDQYFRLETGKFHLGFVYEIGHVLCTDLWTGIQSEYDTIMETTEILNEGDIEDFSDSGDDTYQPK